MPPKPKKKPDNKERGTKKKKVPEEEKAADEELPELMGKAGEDRLFPDPVDEDDDDEDDEEDKEMTAAMAKDAADEAAKKPAAKRKANDTGADDGAAVKKNKGGRPKGSGNKNATKAATAKTTTQKSRFTAVEDLLLCRAYLSVSEDATKGANMRSETFWDAVLEKFRFLCQQAKLENWDRWRRKSVETRWRTHIIRDMNKFNAYYRSVKSEKKSGWNDDDYLKKAIENFEAVEGKFRFQHCLDTLWKSPKFDPMIQPIDVDEEEGGAGHNEISGAMGSKLSRPVGVKAAKKIVTDDKTHFTLKREANLHLEKMGQTTEAMSRAVTLRQLNDSDW